MSNSYNSVQEFIQQGLQFLAANRLRDAYFCMEQALNLDPTNALAHQYMNQIQQQLNAFSSSQMPLPDSYPPAEEADVLLEEESQFGLGAQFAVDDQEVELELEPESNDGYDSHPPVSVDIGWNPVENWEADELELPMEAGLSAELPTTSSIQSSDDVWIDDKTPVHPTPVPSEEELALAYQTPKLTPSFSSPSEVELSQLNPSASLSSDELELPMSSQVELDKVPSQGFFTAFESEEVEQAFAFNTNFVPPALLAAEEPDSQGSLETGAGSTGLDTPQASSSSNPATVSYSSQEQVISSGSHPEAAQALTARQNLNEMYGDVALPSSHKELSLVEKESHDEVVFPQQTIGFPESAVDNTLEEVPQISSVSPFSEPEPEPIVEAQTSVVSPPPLPVAVKPVPSTPPEPRIAAPSASSKPKVNVSTMLIAAEELLRARALEDARELLDSIEVLEPENARLRGLRTLFASHEKNSLEQKFSSLKAVPRLKMPLEQLQHMQFDNHEGFVLSQIDGMTSLDNIMLICGLDKFTLLRMMDKFSRLDIVSV